MKNIYVIQKATETTIRGIWIEQNEDGVKYVKDIYELEFDGDGSEKYLKKIVKTLCDMMFVGEDGEYEIYASTDMNSKIEYDTSLEGKARKRISKEINVLTNQLFG